MIECVPTAREEIVNVALPEGSSVPVPMPVAPSRNATVPVGVAPCELTLTLNVTACPNTDGFCEEARTVVVSVLVTVNKAELEAPVPKAFVNTAR
jgi:hypothetical protein